jgi:cell division septation protein DedD
LAWYNPSGLSPHTQDDGFHEIQLNGKQLVFLFMAATVVSVVIFLCGVLVGRGVRAERGSVADAAATEGVPDPDVPVASSTTGTAATPPPAAGSDPRNAAPPAPAEDLSYVGRLEREQTTPEAFKPAVERSGPPAPEKPSQQKPAAPPSAATPPRTAAPAAAAVAAPAAPPVAAPKPDGRAARTAAASAPAAAAPATGSGYAVQIAALNDRREADAMARRLSSKGYTAYVLAPANGTPAVYRVRIGTFPTRREADQMAAKLQKEEQFTPWVTR